MSEKGAHTKQANERTYERRAFGVERAAKLYGAH